MCSTATPPRSAPATCRNGASSIGSSTQPCTPLQIARSRWVSCSGSISSPIATCACSSRSRTARRARMKSTARLRPRRARGDTKRACLARARSYCRRRSLALVFLRRQLEDDAKLAAPPRSRSDARKRRMTASREPTSATDAPRLRCSSAATGPRVLATQWITDRNPSDASDIVAYVPEGVADDAQRAATAAADAFGAWRRSRASPAPITSIAGASRSRTARRSWRRP